MTDVACWNACCRLTATASVGVLGVEPGSRSSCLAIGGCFRSGKSLLSLQRNPADNVFVLDWKWLGPTGRDIINLLGFCLVLGSVFGGCSWLEHKRFSGGDAGWDGGEWGLPELWKVLQRLMFLVKVLPALNMNTWVELCIVMNDAMEFEG